MDKTFQELKLHPNDRDDIKELLYHIFRNFCSADAYAARRAVASPTLTESHCPHCFRTLITECCMGPPWPREIHLNCGTVSLFAFVGFGV